MVGPVGQGKSTTLAAIIDRINETRAEHILTIEDPVEYLFDQKKSMIHQREVHIDTPDFATGLQGAFREDVNVIMVGEMRDYETISSAVTAAETCLLYTSILCVHNQPHTWKPLFETERAVLENRADFYSELFFAIFAVPHAARESFLIAVFVFHRAIGDDELADVF